MLLIFSLYNSADLKRNNTDTKLDTISCKMQVSSTCLPVHSCKQESYWYTEQMLHKTETKHKPPNDRKQHLTAQAKQQNNTESPSLSQKEIF